MKHNNRDDYGTDRNERGINITSALIRDNADTRRLRTGKDLVPSMHLDA